MADHCPWAVRVLFTKSWIPVRAPSNSRAYWWHISVSFSITVVVIVAVIIIIVTTVAPYLGRGISNILNKVILWE